MSRKYEGQHIRTWWRNNLEVHINIISHKEFGYIK